MMARLNASASSSRLGCTKMRGWAVTRTTEDSTWGETPYAAPDCGRLR
jgi:hypothetical protein